MWKCRNRRGEPIGDGRQGVRSRRSSELSSISSDDRSSDLVLGEPADTGTVRT